MSCPVRLLVMAREPSNARSTGETRTLCKDFKSLHILVSKLRLNTNTSLADHADVRKAMVAAPHHSSLHGRLNVISTSAIPWALLGEITQFVGVSFPFVRDHVRGDWNCTSTK